MFFKVECHREHRKECRCKTISMEKAEDSLGEKGPEFVNEFTQWTLSPYVAMRSRYMSKSDVEVWSGYLSRYVLWELT